MNALIGQIRCASKHNTAQFANIFSLRKNVVLIAENEEQVSEEDRALHEELAEEIVSRLLDSGDELAISEGVNVLWTFKRANRDSGR